jgi:hypothetical protein
MGPPRTSSATHLPALRFLPQPKLPRVVLYDQYNNAGANATSSQDFEAAFDPFDSFTADDFVVPGGQSWSVESVDADGVYFNGFGPAASFHVFFYSDSAGLPGALVATRSAQPYVQGGSTFSVTLSPAVALGPGTYWVSVQCRMDFTPGGQWGWTDRTIQTNNGAAWQNPGLGFGICPTWGRRGTTCLIDPGVPDQVFRLNGTLGGGTPTPTPTPTPTVTPTCPPAAFGNPTPISIPDSGPASPYPSDVVVSGLTGTVTKVTVTIGTATFGSQGIFHTFPDDLDFLLVGPAGQNAIIMSDVGGGFDVSGVVLTLDDDAATPLPDGTQLVSGTFQPANYGTGDTWPPPAPAPLGGSALSIFNGTDPNGTWSLYLVDDAGGDLGSVAGGWGLTITAGCATPTPTPTPTATPSCTPGLLVGSALTIGYGPNNFTLLASNIVNYTFANSQAAPNEYAVFQSHDPWGFTILTDAITANGHTFSVFTPAQLAGFTFSNYRVIVLNWDDEFLTGFLADYTAAIPALEAYVNAGGVVWVQASIQGTTGDTYPMPFGGQGNWFLSPSDTIIDPASPMVAGVPDPIIGNFASHADHSGLPGGAHVVVTETDPNGPSVLYDLRPGGGCGPTPTPTPTVTPTPTCTPGGTPGAWSQSTPYPTTIVRYGFAQTATHFYVFGGVDNGARVNAVNRMDIATGAWQARAAMPFTSEAPTCALMASTGIVYCTEGDTGSNFASYNIATDSWTPLASIPGGDHYGSASGAFNG